MKSKSRIGKEPMEIFQEVLPKIFYVYNAICICTIGLFFEKIFGYGLASVP